jgi:hypothetical protein
MNVKFLVVAFMLVTAGCATAPTGPGAGAGLGAIAGNLLSAHIRADRAAATAVANLIGGAIGYQRGKIMEGRIAIHEAAAIRSESGFNPSLTLQSVPYRDESGQPVESPALQSITMEVGQAEMLTPEGTLHPRAARALARMDSMAREHGGDFSVTVPRSQMQTVDAIKAVVPSATIFQADADEHYRLIVVGATR